VQFGADEAESLMQPAAFHAGAGCDAGLRKAIGDILQDCRVLGENEAIIGAQRRHQPERVYLIKIRAVVLHDLGLRIDLEVSGLGAGFAATSLDDLSAATGMNRPSLYGAFGDKRELYLKSYARYRADARAAMIDIFREELPIRQRLGRIFAVALDIYLSGDAGPRGCFTVMTAASEAISDPEIRAMVLEGFSELDKAFAACFRLAKENGELPASADPQVLAQLASATIHTIAVRARARVPRGELEAIVAGAIDVMVPLQR
jgi:AcrR family transcriptional regulator